MFDKDNKFGFIVNNNENINNSDIKKYVDDKIEILPIKNSYTIFKDSVPSLNQDVASYGTGGGDVINKTYIFDNLQNTDMMVDAVEFNLIISFNDGTVDITKNIAHKGNIGTGFEIYEDGYFINLDYSADVNLIGVHVNKDAPQEIPCIVTKGTFICSLYSNLLQNYIIEGINYKQITQVPDKLKGLTDGRYEVLNNKEYYYLYDNSFVWDMNRINERLDENSGVKQNTSVTTISRRVIKVNQKDSEGIGFGQLVPVNNKRNVTIFAKADADVIVKVYNPNTKKLLLTMNFDTNNSFEFTKAYIQKYQLNGANNIFIAFTTKDTPTNFQLETKVHNLIVTDEYTFLKKEEILTKANTKEYTPTNDYNPATKKYVDDSRDYYFKTPTILYDDPNLPKGYVDITTLENGTNYRVNSSIVSGFFKVSLKAPNDDGTWFTVDDGSNTIGWSSMLSTSICVQLKSDTFIAINMNCINNYCKYLSITKENGKWKLMQTKLNSISPDNTYKYDVTNDYNPAHKKYVDDKVSSLPRFSFNESGELVVKIGDTTKIFVPKNE